METSPVGASERPLATGEVVAIVPAYDEAATIGSVVLSLQEHVDDVIVVDDGSTDETRPIAERAGASVIQHERNRGKGAAIRSGFDHLGDDSEICVLLDGDGQHDVDLVSDLVRPIRNDEADFVVGVRSIDGEGSLSKRRYLGRRFLDAMTNLSTSTSVSDTQSGFRAINASAIDDVVPSEDGFGVESEMLHAASEASLTVEEVPIRSNYPADNEPSRSPLLHGLGVVASLLRTVRTSYPLAFFGTIGFFALAIGGILGFQTASHYYATQEFWPGKAMLSMLFVLVGTQFLMSGLILDFIKHKL